MIMQHAPLNPGNLPVEITLCRAVNRHWRVIEGPWLNKQDRCTLKSFKVPAINLAVLEGGAGSASLFPLVLNKYQTWCLRCNEPRPPLLPYGVSKIRVPMCTRCRVSRLLDFWCLRNEATLEQLPTRPVIGRKCNDMARRNAADLSSDPRLLQLALYAHSGSTTPIATDVSPLINQHR
ncbi:hypothetical protein AMAG_18363 [Allomyces macrogynus ATCC 38327]|uniref:Uncharacterized protein n=1 Tax=Allomyces macrogynus (strain ATCC 38327) TaxID=578462 RepID=A0A0L0S6I7_ALLM3|nr:hypothetical protein AMAG_18363 [Allomyces macrogynus ATCC 38327]|eukprot:KNE58006.1 hypothetical protein AMAG_18363 [Allomyces macrogynus ATCC 38327]